jgi:hypothetical protein
MRVSKAAENLVMQYRVERAARWMGKFAIVVFGLALVAAVASLLQRNIFEGAGAGKRSHYPISLGYH